MANFVTNKERPSGSVSPTKSALVIAGICVAIAVGNAAIFSSWNSSPSAPGVLAIYNVLILILGAHYKRPAFMLMAIAGFALAITLAVSWTG